MRRVGVLVIVVAAGMGVLLWNERSIGKPPTRPLVADSVWAGLDPQGRCESAASLVTSPEKWRTVCRWRRAGEAVQGQAFPPPAGPPPFDDPHIEIYLAAGQTREQVANAIAHEFGHMHHTREFASVDRWLAARQLPADTPWEVWTEDYAEVFAALFSPPADHWRAPTPRPSAEALLALKGPFFS